MLASTSDVCRLCARVRDLTEEHVIPRSAENKASVQLDTFQSLADGFRTGTTQRQGLTRRSLCHRCNNFGNKHYVGPFAQWTRTLLSEHSKLRPGDFPLLAVTADFLAVSKQIAIMAIAAAELPSIRWGDYPRLRGFVLNPKATGGLGDFRLFVYFHFGRAVHEGGFSAIDTTGGPTAGIYCQVGRPPLGYVVTFSDQATLDWAHSRRLCDVTNFAEMQPGQVSTRWLNIPCLNGGLPFRAISRKTA